MKLNRQENLSKICWTYIILIMLLPPLRSVKAAGQENGNNSSNNDSLRAVTFKDSDDSLLIYLNPDSSRLYEQRDNLKARAILEEIKRELFTLRNISRDLRNNKISSDEANKRRFPITQRIKPRLEEAIRADPFDRVVKSWFRSVYRNLENRYRQREEWKKYIPIANIYIHILDEKNRYSIFDDIGNAYYQLSELEQSHYYYKKSIASLFENYEDSLNANSSRYIRALRIRLNRRYRIEEKLSKIDATIISLSNLLQISPDEQQKIIRAKLRKLKWDDRNINASEKKIEAIKLSNAEKYDEAYKLYKEILDSVKTEVARDEINWRLSRLEFFQLKRQYQGLNRLWQVIKKGFIDSGEAQSDSTYREYLGNYARMCYEQGRREYRELGHLRAAFIYFSRASEIKSPYQARACYFLTALVSGSPKSIKHSQKTIEYGTKAWRLKNDLGKISQKNLAFFISRAYQEKGDFDSALEWYEIYYRL